MARVSRQHFKILCRQQLSDGQSHPVSRHIRDYPQLSGHVGVSKNKGTSKWMVYNGKPYLKWMIWGKTPLFLETSMCFLWTLCHSLFVLFFHFSTPRRFFCHFACNLKDFGCCLKIRGFFPAQRLLKRKPVSETVSSDSFKAINFETHLGCPAHLWIPSKTSKAKRWRQCLSPNGLVLNGRFLGRDAGEQRTGEIPGENPGEIPTGWVRTSDFLSLLFSLEDMTSLCRTVGNFGSLSRLM